MTESEEITEIRRAVQALCAEFPGEYWREKDRDRAYPGEFVDALTKSGFLAALIPEEFGGSGLSLDAAAVIMEEIQAAGCNGASAHAQMYIMNTLLRYGNAEQKAKWSCQTNAKRSPLVREGRCSRFPSSGTGFLRTSSVTRSGSTIVSR